MLIKVNTEHENITVSARDLHEFLEVGTRYNDWFPRMCEYGFNESVDFNLLKNERAQLEGNRTVTRTIEDAEITIEMAKEICMLQRNEKGKQARQYFIQLEKAWNSPAQVMARALQLADKQIKSLSTTVSEMKPKAEFYDQVTNSSTAVPMDIVAKTLNMGIGRNNLFKLLRECKVLQSNNIPLQSYVDNGWFRVIESKYNVGSEVRVSFKTVVYQKGINGIRKIIEKEREKL